MKMLKAHAYLIETSLCNMCFSPILL